MDGINKYYGTKYQIVHLKKSNYDLCIDRSSKWGNPFILDNSKDLKERATVITQYKNYLINQLKTKQLNIFELIDQKNKILTTELRSLVLGCWCYPRLCHGDVLASVADEIEETITPIKWTVLIDKNYCKSDVKSKLEKSLKYLNKKYVQLRYSFPLNSNENLINEFAIEQQLKVKLFISDTRYGSQSKEIRNYDLINNATHISVFGEMDPYTNTLLSLSKSKKAFYI